MNVKEFVETTLQEILAGVSQAQATDGGGNINAAFSGLASGQLIDGGSHGLFTRVDFDLAVTAETTGGGKASLKVWSIGAEGGGEHRSHSVSRVSFAVPLRLPDGDQSKADEARKRMDRGNASRGKGGSWMG